MSMEINGAAPVAPEVSAVRKLGVALTATAALLGTVGFVANNAEASSRDNPNTSLAAECHGTEVFFTGGFYNDPAMYGDLTMEEVELSIFGVGGGIAVAEDLPSGEFASVEYASGRVSVDSDDARYSVIAGDFSDSVTVSFEGIDCSNETTTTEATTSTTRPTTTTEATTTTTEQPTTTTEATTTTSEATTTTEGTTTTTEAATTTTEATTTTIEVTTTTEGTTSTTGVTSTTGTTVPGSTTSTTKTETSLIPPISIEQNHPTVPKSGGATPIKAKPDYTG